MNIRTTICSVAMTALLAGVPTLANAADYEQEKTNLLHFHMVDFIGWNNNNMDVMRTYHGADVAVDMAGMHTDGIEAHVEILSNALSGDFNKIVQHSPSVAEGEWTAVVGVQGNSSIATIAIWKDGVMSAEYLFLRPLTDEEIKAVDVSKPIVTVTTPDDQDLRAATGAEAGWSAVMVDGNAIFTQTTDGEVTKQLGFTSM